jgi:hypothetical protein
MSKELQFFKGELPSSQDKFHFTRYGQLYLLFDTNKSEILPGHAKVIKEKVVTFIVQAVRSLGPDEYDLKVLGMTSATGTHEYNSELAGKRAYNSAMAAIKMFEELAPKDPTLRGTTLNPIVEVLAEKYSAFDAKLLHLRTSNRIEKSQGFFRSAVFAFKAANDVEQYASKNIVITGPEAVRRAMELLGNPHAMNEMPYESPWGKIIFKRGQVWNPHTRLIVSLSWDHIVYLQEQTLWSVPTPDLAREIMLDGYVEGGLRAKPLVEATVVVMAFIQGIFVGPTVAISAKLIVLFMWGGAHDKLVKAGYDALGPVHRGLKMIHERYPTLYRVILDKIGEQVSRQLKDALYEDVTSPENIAFFLGRIIRGLFFGPDISQLSPAEQEIALKSVQLTFGRFAFVVVEVAVLVTALHLPAALVAVTTEKIKELADKLQTSFKKAQVDIALIRADAEQIARELTRYSDTPEKMKELEKPMKDLQKVLLQFAKDMDIKGVK